MSSEGTCSKRRVSARYPFQRTRIYVKDYFGAPPLVGNLVRRLLVLYLEMSLVLAD